MSYFIGLDLGQAQDYSAVTVLEMVQVSKQIPGDGKYRIENNRLITPTATTETKTGYHIRHLQRFKLGTSYVDVVAQVGKMMSKLPGSVLVVDATGVGAAPVDMFRQAQLNPVAVTITGGDKVAYESGSWRVPKRDLVGALAVAFQTGTLKIAPELPEAKVLIDELLNFKVKINLKTAHDSYESWREGIHDDMVLSAALALWYSVNQGGEDYHVISGVYRW